MNFVGSANTPGDSIDPSVRKKRGPQDDKSEEAGPSFRYFSTRGCPTLPAVSAGGWAFENADTTPNRSRFRAVHCDSISTTARGVGREAAPLPVLGPLGQSTADLLTLVIPTRERSETGGIRFASVQTGKS